jgi:hypothetical protein
LRLEIAARIVEGGVDLLAGGKMLLRFVRLAAVSWSESRFCRIPRLNVMSDMAAYLIQTAHCSRHLYFVILNDA